MLEMLFENLGEPFVDTRGHEKNWKLMLKAMDVMLLFDSALVGGKARDKNSYHLVAACSHSGCVVD